MLPRLFLRDDDKEFIPADEVGDSDAEGGEANHGVDDEVGASGESSAINLSEGGLVAIIVVVTVVAVLGITTAALFYVAKKREWKMREKFRQSARKVVKALTPRRTEFPKELKDPADEVPPTPRLRPEDVEKGMAMSVKPSKGTKTKIWSGRG